MNVPSEAEYVAWVILGVADAELVRRGTELVNDDPRGVSEVVPLSVRSKLVGWLSAVDETPDGALLDEESPLSDSTDEIAAVDDSC